MMNLRTVKVSWFDQLKGIGEGLDEAEQPVFLKANNIKANNTFQNLSKGEIVQCKVKVGKDGMYAETIFKNPPISDLELPQEPGTIIRSDINTANPEID